MATRAGGMVVRALRATAAAEATDRELLERFAAGDEAAFAALVSRHGGLVLGVCRRVLPTVQDAEDAAQAVFLTLAKKAGGRWQSSIANWLYATARRVAATATRTARRRARLEAGAVPESTPSALDQMTGREAFAALDAELDRLPAMYREPLVLCHLQGLTRDEAAARLGVPAGTLKTRLARGRKRLADALTKRGIVLGAGFLAVAATSPAGASPPALMKAVLAAVHGSPSPAAAALAQGVAMTGAKTTLKVTAVLVGIAGLGFALTGVPLGAQPPKPPADTMEKPKTDVKADARRDEVKEWSMAGTVLGPDGKPVQADLILLRTRGKPEPLGKSAADGTFQVTLTAADGDHVIARADGYGVDFRRVYFRGPAEVTFRLAKDNPIRGRVVDTEGKPVTGAVVYPSRTDDFGTGGADVFLNHWSTRHPLSPPLSGEPSMTLGRRTGLSLPDGRTVLSAVTDQDGKFELSGLGAERVVTLSARGPGIADAEVLVVNRADFDPAAANKAAADNLDRTVPKELRAQRFPAVHGPTVTVVAEPEKVIRGVVTDSATGKPRAGVEVVCDQLRGMYLLPGSLTAVTDRDGRFEIRGGRKRPGYVVEVPASVSAGYLMTAGEVKDTAGYGPVELKLATAKGVILAGKLTDGTTGKPVGGGTVWVEPAEDNPHLKTLPAVTPRRKGSVSFVVRPDGTYTAVIPPGPVLVMAAGGSFQAEELYKPPQPDPKYPKYFFTMSDRLSYVTASGGYAPVLGNWVKVIDTPADAKEATLDIAFERAKRKAVKVVDAAGKPVTTCYAAGGKAPYSFPRYQSGGEIGVYELKADEARPVVACEQSRKLIGSLVVTDADNDPVLKLQAGGSVTGRVVGADGKPLAGVRVELTHTDDVANSVFNWLHPREAFTTDAAGQFRIDHVVPGHEFQLTFSKGTKNLVPKADGAPRHTVDKPGGKLDLGELKRTDG